MKTSDPAQTVHPLNRILNIFISHKMPADTKLAQSIGTKLAKFGANRIKVRFAEQYPYGDNWREHIQEDINKSDMLIYLHTGEYDDWLFCLFECGMFVNRPGQDSTSLGITTFCKSMDNIAAPLREFNSLVMSTDAILKLYRQIYIDPPWSISPMLTDSDFMPNARDIVTEFMKSYYVVHNFDVTPSFTIELDKGPDTEQSLASGKLPDNGLVSGSTEWQLLFGKDINTGDWSWGRLRESWAYARVYEYLISKIVERAIVGLSTRAILLRAAGASVLYRAALRRYEELSNDKFKFFSPPRPSICRLIPQRNAQKGVR